jgi:hypothetical protein
MDALVSNDGHEAFRCCISQYTPSLNNVQTSDVFWSAWRATAFLTSRDAISAIRSILLKNETSLHILSPR